jgi:nitrate/TMAO reductase-like tetraheme cytochrome c subunit
MGLKNPIWELFDENGDEMYKNNKSNKAARCKACLQFHEAQEARETYNTAITQARQASLMEQQTPDGTCTASQ